MKLAALQLQHDVGTEAGKANLSVDRLRRYLPRKFVAKKGSDNAAIVDEVLAAHADVKKLSKSEAQAQYLKYVQAWKIYGSSFFFVEPQVAHTHLPDEVFLAVNPKGVLIINPETKVRPCAVTASWWGVWGVRAARGDSRLPPECPRVLAQEILAEHPYSEVPTWGHSGSSFVLHIGNLVRQTKIYFHTEQVRGGVGPCRGGRSYRRLRGVATAMLTCLSCCRRLTAGQGNQRPRARVREPHLRLVGGKVVVRNVNIAALALARASARAAPVHVYVSQQMFVQLQP